MRQARAAIAAFASPDAGLNDIAAGARPYDAVGDALSVTPQTQLVRESERMRLTSASSKPKDYSELVSSALDVVADLQAQLVDASGLTVGSDASDGDSPTDVSHDSYAVAEQAAVVRRRLQPRALAPSPPQFQPQLASAPVGASSEDTDRALYLLAGRSEKHEYVAEAPLASASRLLLPGSDDQLSARSDSSARSGMRFSVSSAAGERVRGNVDVSVGIVGDAHASSAVPPPSLSSSPSSASLDDRHHSSSSSTRSSGSRGQRFAASQLSMPSLMSPTEDRRRSTAAMAELQATRGPVDVLPHELISQELAQYQQRHGSHRQPGGDQSSAAVLSGASTEIGGPQGVRMMMGVMLPTLESSGVAVRRAVADGHGSSPAARTAGTAANASDGPSFEASGAPLASSSLLVHPDAFSNSSSPAQPDEGHRHELSADISVSSGTATRPFASSSSAGVLRGSSNKADASSLSPRGTLSPVAADVGVPSPAAKQRALLSSRLLAAGQERTPPRSVVASAAARGENAHAAAASSNVRTTFSQSGVRFAASPASLDRASQSARLDADGRHPHAADGRHPHGAQQHSNEDEQVQVAERKEGRGQGLTMDELLRPSAAAGGDTEGTTNAGDAGNWLDASGRLVFDADADASFGSERSRDSEPPDGTKPASGQQTSHYHSKVAEASLRRPNGEGDQNVSALHGASRQVPEHLYRHAAAAPAAESHHGTSEAASEDAEALVRSLANLSASAAELDASAAAFRAAAAAVPFSAAETSAPDHDVLTPKRSVHSSARSQTSSAPVSRARFGATAPGPTPEDVLRRVAELRGALEESTRALSASAASAAGGRAAAAAIAAAATPYVHRGTATLSRAAVTSAAQGTPAAHALASSTAGATAHSFPRGISGTPVQAVTAASSGSTLAGAGATGVVTHLTAQGTPARQLLSTQAAESSTRVVERRNSEEKSRTPVLPASVTASAAVLTPSASPAVTRGSVTPPQPSVRQASPLPGRGGTAVSITRSAPGPVSGADAVTSLQQTGSASSLSHDALARVAVAAASAAALAAAATAAAVRAPTAAGVAYAALGGHSAAMDGAGVTWQSAGSAGGVDIPPPLRSVQRWAHHAPSTRDGAPPFEAGSSRALGVISVGGSPRPAPASHASPAAAAVGRSTGDHRQALTAQLSRTAPASTRQPSSHGSPAPATQVVEPGASPAAQSALNRLARIDTLLANMPLSGVSDYEPVEPLPLHFYRAPHAGAAGDLHSGERSRARAVSPHASVPARGPVSAKALEPVHTRRATADGVRAGSTGSSASTALPPASRASSGTTAVRHAGPARSLPQRSGRDDGASASASLLTGVRFGLVDLWDL